MLWDVWCSFPLPSPAEDNCDELQLSSDHLEWPLILHLSHSGGQWWSEHNTTRWFSVCHSAFSTYEYEISFAVVLWILENITSPGIRRKLSSVIGMWWGIIRESDFCFKNERFVFSSFISIKRVNRRKDNRVTRRQHTSRQQQECLYIVPSQKFEQVNGLNELVAREGENTLPYHLNIWIFQLKRVKNWILNYHPSLSTFHKENNNKIIFLFCLLPSLQFNCAPLND